MEQWSGLISETALALKKRGEACDTSYKAAQLTLKLVRKVVGNGKWTTAQQIMDWLRSIALRLTAAQPLELAVGNVIRRVLCIIRVDYITMYKQLQSQDSPSRSNHILDPTAKGQTFTVPMKELKSTVMEGVGEFYVELNTMYEHIAEQALEHIHTNEVILTFGQSETVHEFLTVAHKKREFKVFVVEAAGSDLKGQDMARDLGKGGIDVTLIPDSAVYPMMARVNKVIISTNKVMSNGGLIALSGVLNVALAAKANSVPVVCLAGLYKLSPIHPHEKDEFIDMVSPSFVLNDMDATTPCMKNVAVNNPLFDYVGPELVDLFLTNAGGHPPSYIYKLLNEYYSPEDTDFNVPTNDEP